MACLCKDTSTSSVIAVSAAGPVARVEAVWRVAAVLGLHVCKYKNKESVREGPAARVEVVWLVEAVLGLHAF